jgi:hypothetical protein
MDDPWPEAKLDTQESPRVQAAASLVNHRFSTRTEHPAGKQRLGYRCERP